MSISYSYRGLCATTAEILSTAIGASAKRCELFVVAGFFMLLCGCTATTSMFRAQDASVARANRTPYAPPLYMQKTPDQERFRLVLSVADQRIALLDGTAEVAVFKVSTALKGVSEQHDSAGTPRGLHVIAEKIGEGQPVGMVFKGRQPAGYISPLNPEGEPPVVTRLFRLHGLEQNNKNTFDRLIYLHGSPHEALLGSPASGGCIRMSSEDIVRIFSVVSVGTPVFIHEGSLSEATVIALARERGFAELRNRVTQGVNEGFPDKEGVHRLCVGHAYGLYGIPLNYFAAKQWCERSAENSSSSALVLLAEIYELGSLGHTDLDLAYSFYEKAAASQHKYAIAKLRRLRPLQTSLQ
jgi:L,D-transpeptidase catalytic domain